MSFLLASLSLSFFLNLSLSVPEREDTSFENPPFLSLSGLMQKKPLPQSDFNALAAPITINQLTAAAATVGLNSI